MGNFIHLMHLKSNYASKYSTSGCTALFTAHGSAGDRAADVILGLEKLSLQFERQDVAT